MAIRSPVPHPPMCVSPPQGCFASAAGGFGFDLAPLRGLSPAGTRLAPEVKAEPRAVPAPALRDPARARGQGTRSARERDSASPTSREPRANAEGWCGGAGSRKCVGPTFFGWARMGSMGSDGSRSGWKRIRTGREGAGSACDRRAIIGAMTEATGATDPHPLTGTGFISPVPPGIGWPGDPADTTTPVAHSADGVARLARSATDIPALDARVSVCRACPRLVAWRERVATIGRRASFAHEP